MPVARRNKMTKKAIPDPKVKVFTCKCCGEIFERKVRLLSHEEDCRSENRPRFTSSDITIPGSESDWAKVDNNDYIALNKTIVDEFDDEIDVKFESSSVVNVSFITTDEVFNSDQELIYSISQRMPETKPVSESFLNSVDVDDQWQGDISITSVYTLRPPDQDIVVCDSSVDDLEDEISLTTNGTNTRVPEVHGLQFSPLIGSTPCGARQSREVRGGDLEAHLDLSNSEIIDELEKTADKVFSDDGEVSESRDDNESGDKVSGYQSFDIDKLLESDDEEDDDRAKVARESFSEEDIVWEIWYYKKTAKGRVLDHDLTQASPCRVMAQLCVVTSLHLARRGNKVTGLSLVPVSGDTEPAINIRQGEHKVDIKFVRKFGSFLENKKIRDCQKYRADYPAFLSQFETVERYLTNHVGLENVPVVEQKTARQFFAMDSLDRCLYIEGLRRMKQGLDKKIPPRNEESFERSLIKEGVYDHLKKPPKKTSVPMKNNTETDVKTLTIEEDDDEEEDILSTLDPEMLSLVSSLSPSWPLSLAKSSQEHAKLSRILTRRRRSRRHELFMDAKQRSTKHHIPELIRLANPSFLNLFGRRREVLDRDVRLVLQENVVYRTGKVRQGTDPRLVKLLDQSPNFCRDYVELVLYPELFISWVRGVRGCTQMEADQFYQRVGCLVSEKERRAFLANHRGAKDESGLSESEDDMCSD